LRTLHADLYFILILQNCLVSQACICPSRRKLALGFVLNDRYEMVPIATFLSISSLLLLSPSSNHLLRLLSLSLSLSQGLSLLCYVNKKAISPSYLHPYNLDLLLTYSDLCEFLFLFPSVCDGTFAITILSFNVPNAFSTHPSSFLYDQLQKYLNPKAAASKKPSSLM